MDFFRIRERNTKSGIEIFPDFIVGNHKDFMIRGHAFYAIYDAESGMWSTDDEMVQKIVDNELRAYASKRQEDLDGLVKVQYMSDYNSNVWAKYKRYLKDMFDCYHNLDSTLTFQNQKRTRTDYASKRLPYCLEDGDCSAWDELVGTLYSTEEREKIEWAIGSIIAGDSKKISKFFVLYGAPGSGKGTILDIIAKLFDGYYCIIESKSLGSRTSDFSTAPFKDNPLVAIEYDSDLSRVETNTRLNSIISHETIPVRELYKAAYNVRINAMIFLATNSPVMITDSKSGIIRRLIDVNPSGLKIPSSRYVYLQRQIEFELGAIAKHCLDVYKKLGVHYYDAYRSVDMMERTDIFFNFVEESYFTFKKDNAVTLKRAWSMFKEYTEEAGLKYLMPKHKFKQELREYFSELIKDTTLPNGTRVTNYYRGFLAWKVDGNKDITILDKDESGSSMEDVPPWLQLNEDAALNSILDNALRDCPAQYANEEGTPFIKWDNVNGTLKMLNTHFLHYVLMPDNYIVIDFDLKDPITGEKSAKLNLEAASHWPPTYAEFSKSGAGLHLHYIYGGDVNLLKSIYSDDIEIKVFKGHSSLRRQLTKCNNIPIKTISSGLPLREEKKKVINHEAVKSERVLRDLIRRSLTKEFGATKPSVDFINHILVEAKESGLTYDVNDMKQAIMYFAMNSTNQAEYCMRLASQMPYKSEEPSESGTGRYSDERLVFFDVEVFPNLFLVNWKYAGSDSCTRMINPTPEEIGALFKYKLVGFNNRRYDNHILYARYIGYNNEELYHLSQKIINNEKNCTFGEAFNLSYTDVYDFASAAHKKSLKKWEIELGLHHQELGLPWDEPVPEDQWVLVAEYCDNDVISTEAVFYHLSGDFRAREILADIADMTVNDSTNALTTRIIFGKEKHPKLNWHDLAEDFPGYQYKNGHNMYRGDDVGRGGWVYANPGMYSNCVTYDVASMHPRSIIELRYLGDYTDRFEDLVNIRLFIKHGDYESVGKLFDGKLKPYLKNKEEAKDLSNALKTAINSVYGLTSATFDNPFRDRRNKNNIVALRGALFMRTLQDEVEHRGFNVVHIKTDSIKVENPTPEIEKYIYEFGQKYGYTFEVEAKWEKICLVNNAVFVGKQSVESPDKPGKWTATGKQFQEPYVFKKIFSHEPIEFKDCCLTVTTKSALYLDMNEKLAEGDSMPVFVGRAGCFCPIQPGHGGGELKRIESDGRLSYASGAKGYRFLEAETVAGTETEEYIDKSYFEKLVDDAVEDISKFGDYYRFVEDNSDIPWLMPCGDLRMGHCYECPHFLKDHDLCNLGFDISEVLLKSIKEN